MGIYCCLLDLQTNRYQSRIVLIEQVWSANPKASGFQGGDWYCQVGLCESIQNSWITGYMEVVSWSYLLFCPNLKLKQAGL